MSGEKYVCLTCEEAGRACVVELSSAGRCPSCNGDSVLSESVLLAFGTASAEKLKNPKVTVRETPVVNQEFQARLRDVEAPVRAFLKRNGLKDLDTWWLGNRYWIEWSFYDKDHSPTDYEHVDLILGNANEEKRLRLYINVEDDSMHEVL